MHKYNLFVRFFLWLIGIKAEKKIEKVVIDLDANIERYEDFGKSQNR